MLKLSQRRALIRGGMLVGLLALGGAFGGCASNNLKSENDRLLAENAELRDRVQQYEGALGTVESERASLEGQVNDLQSQLSQRGSSGSTGFEGIAGVGEIRAGAGEIVVGIAGDVLFDSGSATLKSTAKRSLDEVASVIRSRYGGKMVRVEGYTDTDPIKKSGWKTNERLSGERAMAVETYLVSKGLPNERVYFAGFGPSSPKSSKKQSRRVEIVIVDR